VVYSNFGSITHRFRDKLFWCWKPHFYIPHLYLTLNLKVIALEFGNEIWRQKTRIMELSYGEEIMIVDRTVWATSVSDAMPKTSLCIVSRCKNRWKMNVIITFSWRFSVWSRWLVGTFCCHWIRQQRCAVCVLCETMEQHSIIIHLSAAAARSIEIQSIVRLLALSWILEHSFGDWKNIWLIFVTRIYVMI